MKKIAIELMHVLSKEGVMIQLRVCEIITKAYICALKVRVSISIITVMSVSQQINGHVQKVNHVALGHGLAVSSDTLNRTEKQQQASFNASSLNTNLLVGTTRGVPSVTGTGGANYHIPIETPQGIADLMPLVAVDYNSQSGNGLLGYGWNLVASSSITRCGKTYYYDNDAESPQLSNADNLSLDGQRLILISGSNLAVGSRYRLEYDPFTDIVCNYSGFIVRTKDGSVREYGTSSFTRINASSGGTLLWLLYKSTDKKGNTITYEYDKFFSGIEYYLTKITYAGNRHIKFEYETRDDKQKTYFAGEAINISKRLKRITTHIGLRQLRQYQFEYEFDGMYTKLVEIIESGQNGASYNSTKVTYDYPKQGAGSYASLLPNRNGSTILFGDFNGDGKMDFLSYNYKESYTTADSAFVYLATTNGATVSFVKQCAIPLLVTNSFTPPSWGSMDFSKLLLADLNGDGKTDVVNISKKKETYVTYRYNSFLYDGEKFINTRKGFLTSDEDAIVSDFNGDGKQEILIKSTQSLYNEFGVDIASGGIDDWGSEYVADYYPNNRYLCDFNGNGKTDILVINESGARVYELSGNRFVRLSSFNTTDIKNWYFPYFGDFNGDGKTDVLIQNMQQDNPDDVSIIYSTGKSFVKQSISDANIRSKVYVGDFNRDGKSDIFHMEIINGVVQMKTGIFNGTGFTTARYSTTLPSSSFNIPYEYEQFFYQLADFDGDGYSEFCYARYADYYYIQSFSNTQMLLASRITDGLGACASYEYSSLTNRNICTGFGNETYPVSGSLYPLYVVTKMTQSAGTYYDTETYRYKSPRIHLHGKGFMGFGEIESVNERKNRKKITRYGYNIYYYPYVTDQRETTLSGTNLLSLTYENSYIIQSGKRITPYIKKQTTVDYKTNTTTTVECKEIDSMGEPKKIETRYGLDVTETVSFDYFGSGTDYLWIYGQPLSIEKKIVRVNETWTEKQIIDYNSRYLPEKITGYVNDRKVSEEIFHYDAVGNIMAYLSKPYAAVNILTTRYEYSSDKVFQTKVTDPLGLSTTNQHNALGCLEYVLDHRNNKTVYEYDDMGRLIKIKYPDGKTSSVSLLWGGNVTNGVYYTTFQTTGKPIVKIYYDAFQRELRTSAIRYNNVELCKDKEYDQAGRLYRESLPFINSSATLWNTYEYDTYGRLKTVNDASGKTTSYMYDGRDLIITENGIVTTRRYDSANNLVSIIDPAGTTTYNLRADGQPSSIVAPGYVITSFEYDDYGRQTSIIDPSAGRRMFQYDAAGRLWKEFDVNGIIKELKYDAYNRIINKILPEFTTTYNYNADGLLESEVSTNGTSTNYTYDNQMRPIYVQDNTNDGKWFRKMFSYLSGNLKTVSYASHSGSLGTETYDYSNGHLKEIRFGGTSVWQLNGENPFGQPIAITTGTVFRTYNYDNYGAPTGRIASSSAVGILQNHTYRFDASTDNLSFRKDNTRNLQENFTYDALNRLKTYAGRNVEYDVKGNIMQKNDVATNFLYNTPGKPYAISGANLGTNTGIPLRSQSVTYTSFYRPSSITENGYTASFTYNGSGDRVKMQMSNNNSNNLTRYYLGGGQYEIDETPDGVKEKLYIGGDAYSAPAVYVKQNGSWALHYILRDYLGSITHVTNANGSLVQELSYDTWGRLRNPVNQSVYAPDTEPEPFLGRGYTGHEHLPKFGLINMNARLYDPAIGRFLSPDPYVQSPDFSQSYNRYAYCLNNPLKYTDTNGEAWWHWVLGALGVLDPTFGAATAVLGSASATIFTAAPMAAGTFTVSTFNFYVTGIGNTAVAYMSGVISGGWSEGKKRAGNAWKLTNGLFISDADNSFGNRIWEIFSRHTFQQPFTTVGNWTSNYVNFFSESNVDYFHGATIMQTDLLKGGAGITLGSNIMLSHDGTVDYNNPTLLHEYGHYLQQRQWGALPYTSLSWASLVSAGFDWRSVPTHHQVWAEMDANARSLSYFKNRLSQYQIDRFKYTFANNFAYHDGRFLRSYLLPDFLLYLLYDITWSK